MQRLPQTCLPCTAFVPHLMEVHPCAKDARRVDDRRMLRLRRRRRLPPTLRPPLLPLLPNQGRPLHCQSRSLLRMARQGPERRGRTCVRWLGLGKVWERVDFWVCAMTAMQQQAVTRDSCNRLHGGCTAGGHDRQLQARSSAPIAHCDPPYSTLNSAELLRSMQALAKLPSRLQPFTAAARAPRAARRCAPGRDPRLL